MYNIRFQTCALVIVCMLFAIVFSKKMLQAFSDKVYMILLSIITGSIVFDMVSTVIAVKYVSYEAWEGEILLKLYLSSLVLTMFFIFLLIAADALGGKRKLYRIFWLALMPAFYGICYIFVQEITYTIYNGMIFFNGIAAYITCGVCCLYLLFMIVLLRSKRANMKKEMKQSAQMVIVFFVILLVFGIMHISMRLESLALSLIAAFIYMNLKNANEHIDKSLGIFNQNAFEYYLRDLSEDERPVYIIYIGFDDFKAINTTFGFENGRALFKDIAASLAGIYEGKVFRMDAYELACVFSGSKLAYRNYRSTVRYKIREDFSILDAHVKVASYIVEIPLKSFRPDDTELNTIMKKYMERLLISGQNYVLVKEEQFRELRKQNRIRRLIEQAITSKHVEMYYQPIYNVDTNEFDSAEALLRLRDEDHNVIPARLVISIAEDAGLILQLGDVIFEKVFSFLTEHEILTTRLKKLHINLSGMQSASEHFVSHVYEMMEAYHIPPSYIDLELRQKAQDLNDHVLLNNLESLSGFGTTLSLDDYGRGEVNLESLMEWPIHYVKLDRELVHIDKPSKKAEQALFFVLKMAKQLGMQVVAKGVESPEDYERMHKMHVDYMQGFYLAEVLDENDFLDFLEKPLIMGKL